MDIFQFSKNKGFIPLEAETRRGHSRLLTGFTLVEALVAITVLTLALGGPMTLATRSIKDSLASRNKVVAFYLAQEAIEYVRNVRDSNFLNKMSGGAPGWLDGLGYCTAGNCYIDVINDNVTDCGGSCVSPLKFDGNNYNYTAPDNSIFTRTIKITNPDNTQPLTGDEAEVTVTVTWEDYGQRMVTLTQNMFNLAP